MDDPTPSNAPTIGRWGEGWGVGEEFGFACVSRENKYLYVKKIHKLFRILSSDMDTDHKISISINAQSLWIGMKAA